MIEYVKSESTVKPKEYEESYGTVYLRKNIVHEKRTDENGYIYYMYVYEEAVMTVEEFNLYSSKIASTNALKDVDNATNINQLLDGQQMGDMNQITIMEAIADLYDLVATKGTV